MHRKQKKREDKIKVKKRGREEKRERGGGRRGSFSTPLENLGGSGC